MPSRFDRAVDVTKRSLVLAVVPIVATLLSLSKVTRTLGAGRGGGVTFPFPSGLPTLWTYVSVPNAPVGTSGGGVGSLVAIVPLFLLGLLVTSALEAGFLGSLANRIDGESLAFAESVRRFTVRMVGVNVVRVAIVVAAFPLIVLPPVAIVVVLVLGYLVYGLPFEVVVRDVGAVSALETTVSHALDSRSYAAFGIVHLLAGAVASLFLTALVRNGGVPGIVLGAVLIAVPAVFVAAYGLLVFRDIDSGPDRGPWESTRQGDLPNQ